MGLFMGQIFRNYFSLPITLFHSGPRTWRLLPLLLLAVFTPSSILASEKVITSHGYAMFGELKYAANFNHFDYVNPNAPKGGELRLMGHGTFDSINPYPLKGLSPLRTPGLYIYGFNELNATLLSGSSDLDRSGDEPASAYGYVAEKIEYPESRQWVIFHLRKEATFHNGDPITAEDVVFSFNTLREKGHPEYSLRYQDVESATVVAPRKVKFLFKGNNTRALPLRVGELPIVSKNYWTKHPIDNTTLEPFPGSGLYKINKVDPGTSVVFERVENHWASNLPINKGRYNFDSVRFDFYRDATVAFEAFKAGDYDIHLDYVSKNWATAYDFPALHAGKVIKTTIPHQLPQGSQAFYFNLRRDLFKDRRVRKALSLLFDFEWSNKMLFNGAYHRSNTYYPNSSHSASGIPEGKELALLEPFKDQLPAGFFTEPFTLEKTNGSGKIRQQRREAMQLLKAAGWVIGKDKKLVHAQTGKPFEFEIVNYKSASLDRILQPFIKNLSLVGITANSRMIDPAQYKVRLDTFDFDMTIKVLGQGLTPSVEQQQYFHSKFADIEGNLNLGGIKNPVVDHLVEKVIQAATREDLTTALKALDRVLLWEYFTIPHWYIDYFRIAYWDKFERVEPNPPFALSVQNWWIKQGTAQ